MVFYYDKFEHSTYPILLGELIMNKVVVIILIVICLKTEHYNKYTNFKGFWGKGLLSLTIFLAEDLLFPIFYYKIPTLVYQHSDTLQFFKFLSNLIDFYS